MVRPEESQKALLSVCAERLSESQMKEVDLALAFAKSLESNNASHPSMRAYFSHPLRVARLSFQLLAQPSVEIVALGLLHNVFEVTGLTAGELLEAGFSERLASGIRLMTVDRKRQFDEAYLTDFYGRIQGFGDDLALIKCVDKLDNLLAFQLFDGAVRDQYLETTDRFVTPLAAQLSRPFGDYFTDVIRFMRAAGCDQGLKAQYEAAKHNL